MKEKLVLGIEIGGTKLQLALGTAQGEIKAKIQDRVDIAAGGEGIRQWLKNQIPVFLSTADLTVKDLHGIGVGFGGPMDTKTGEVLKSIQISGWEKFPIRNWFEDQYGLPVIVANDSNAATWGEYQKGYGRGCQHFFYTNLGSGVGGGFVINGQLFDGQGFGAGEFGHTYVPDWSSKLPGRAIKIEDLCSGWAIEARLRTPGYIPETSLLHHTLLIEHSNVTAKDLADAAKKGDVFALTEINRIASSMGLGLANVLCLTGVEKIAIGGGVSKMGSLLIEPIRQSTQKYEFINSTGRYSISHCQLGDEIVLIGAILLAGESL